MILGMLVASTKEVDRALRYSRAAHKLGHEVKIFVTFEAVQSLSQPIWEEITQFAAVIACAQTVHAYQIKTIPQIILGSQFDHAEIAHQADRFLAFV
jgi:hypothetical protein